MADLEQRDQDILKHGKKYTARLGGFFYFFLSPIYIPASVAICNSILSGST